MDLKIKDIWDRNCQFAIKHWGKLKSEPLDADLSILKILKSF